MCYYHVLVINVVFGGTLEPDTENAYKWLEGIVLSEQFNVMVLTCALYTGKSFITYIHGV